MRLALLGGPRDGKVIFVEETIPPGQVRIAAITAPLPEALDSSTFAEFRQYLTQGSAVEVVLDPQDVGLAVYDLVLCRGKRGTTWIEVDDQGRFPYRWTGNYQE